MSAEGVPVGMCHEDGQPHRCGRCDRDIIEALPASTADARVGAWPSKDTLAAMENVFAYMRRMTIQRTSDEAHPDDVESGIYLEGWDQDIVDSLVSESRTLMARLDQAMSDDKALALAAKSGGGK